jgi:predicted membrane channel-forming protein YqfA (hemolysin III family)
MLSRSESFWMNVRRGRMQRTLSAATAAAALPLGAEIYFEHYRGSFGDKWMWTPIALTPPLAIAGVAGVFSERAARRWLPAVSALYVLDGLIGVVTHIRGVRRKPGGFNEPLYNIVMGPPLLAPGSLVMVGAIGLLAAVVERERR